MPATLSLQQMLDEKAEHSDAADKLRKTAKAENREMSAEESAKFDEHLDKALSLQADIDKTEAKEERMRRLDALIEDQNNPRGRRMDSDQPTTSSKTKDYRFDLRGKSIIFPETSAAFKRHTPEARSGFQSWVSHGRVSRSGDLYADLQTDMDNQGGYLTTPEEFMAGILKNVDDATFIRSLARKLTTTAERTGIRCRTAKASTAQWGAELDDTEQHKDKSLRFGKRALTPHYLTGEIVVSNDLLRAGVLDIEAMIGEEIMINFAETEEKAFLTGDGAQKPLGLFTADANGISTARDVSEGNTPTGLTFDGLISAKYGLKPQYRNKATWLFSRTAMKAIAKLKDGDGQYLWQPSRIAGEPDRVLNLPYYESEWIPNTFTSGQYVGILGDFNFYYIVDMLMLQMQRLVEKYANTNQTGFIYRRKLDGQPVLEEAFVRVKLG